MIRTSELEELRNQVRPGAARLCDAVATLKTQQTCCPRIRVDGSPRGRKNGSPRAGKTRQMTELVLPKLPSAQSHQHHAVTAARNQGNRPAAESEGTQRDFGSRHTVEKRRGSISGPPDH
eukprot:768236-Hanusia_phi.AAC.6